MVLRLACWHVFSILNAAFVHVMLANFSKKYVCTHSDHRFALCVDKIMLNYTLQVFDFLELIANIPNQYV